MPHGWSKFMTTSYVYIYKFYGKLPINSPPTFLAPKKSNHKEIHAVDYMQDRWNWLLDFKKRWSKHELDDVLLPFAIICNCRMNDQRWKCPNCPVTTCIYCNHPLFIPINYNQAISTKYKTYKTVLSNIYKQSTRIWACSNGCFMNQVIQNDRMVLLAAQPS